MDSSLKIKFTSIFTFRKKLSLIILYIVFFNICTHNICYTIYMVNTIINRKDVNVNDTWDLSVLFTSRENWDKAREEVLSLLPTITVFEGTLTEDANLILRLFKETNALSQKIETICAYAHLEYSTDASSNNSQELMGLMQSMIASVSPALSFIEEELSTLSEKFLTALSHNETFKDYRQSIVQLIRKKQHILSKKEEKLLAQQTEYSGGFDKAFSALTDIDMEFGSIDTPEGTVALSQASFRVLMEHDDRAVRKNAYTQYFTEYQNHINTIAVLYASNVQKDNAIAKIRNYKNALERKLYNDNIPRSLYDDLIRITHTYLPVLHDYYGILKKKSGLEDYALFDISAKLYPVPEHDMSYDEAASLVCDACVPLGDEYVRILKKGLTEDRWVDKYENKGKRSGAFSSGVYNAYPYILMNYQSKSLNHVFTLAHEAGHSMHSYFASKHNPYSQHDYTIFEAEVASTVNEFLLSRYLINNTDDAEMKTYLLWNELQDFIGTFFRQTMFAEFELQVHEQSDKGLPLTVEYFSSLILELYKKYSGDNVVIPALSGNTGLRIPHFYRSYYVYKYATGIAAAVDIGTRIVKKEDNVIEKYFDFLKSGGSRFPIDALKLAGVDYTSPKPIENALQEFQRKVTLLKTLSQ